MAAKILANVSATLPAKGEAKPVLVSVRSGSYDVVERAGQGEVHSMDFSFQQSSLRQTLREIVKATGGTVDLAEAEVIVAAGRGVKDEEGKRLISELASLFNAGIGASRALTESGVYDPSVQIGQTGKVVSPQLYFAVGISGAIQHVAGMSNSKVIVAINKDPDAPIFEVADYGLVGDLYQILPALIEEIKAIKG
jgi:electron transfer flavoprotein alpha subunit